MKNALEKYRTGNGLTYEALAMVAGFKSRGLVYGHCKNIRKISAESAIRYEMGVGIPRSELRPDLWPPAPDPLQGTDDAA